MRIGRRSTGVSESASRHVLMSELAAAKRDESDI